MGTTAASQRVGRSRAAEPSGEKADFSGVTELPGNLAHREQLSILYTRYHWAAGHCRDKDVLEVACGAGQGLGYLRRVARRVVGGDIEEKNLAFARRHYQGRDGIELRTLDAESLPFADGTFDRVLLFEAIYYLPEPERFMDEARRVLRPDGTLLVSSVNCQWHGFNPSPWSVRYHSGPELVELAERAGLGARLFAAFPDRADSLGRKAVAAARRAAVALHLIPKTMKGKALLKRIFYGRLREVPWEIEDGTAPAEPLREVRTRPRSIPRFERIW